MLNAFGPPGSAAASMANGVLTQWITNWSFKLDAGDMANIMINTAFGFLAGLGMQGRGDMLGDAFPETAEAAAAAELSTIANTLWGWVTPL